MLIKYRKTISDWLELRERITIKPEHIDTLETTTWPFYRGVQIRLLKCYVIWFNSKSYRVWSRRKSKDVPGASSLIGILAVFPSRQTSHVKFNRSAGPFLKTDRSLVKLSPGRVIWVPYISAGFPIPLFPSFVGRQHTKTTSTRTSFISFAKRSSWWNQRPNTLQTIVEIC